MALDTLTINYITKELNETILNGRVEKVYQPEKDEIIILVKTYENSYKLVVSANSSQPRIHLTEAKKENPQKAPLFCMLLRKHLQSGKIISVEQISNERIIKIDISSYDELGDLTVKQLYCEIMGRNSNIILCNEDNVVIDSVKHIDFSVSSVRQILPGIKYNLPPIQDKQPILSKHFESNSFDFSKEGTRADKALMNTVTGIAPLIAREIVYSACKSLPDCSEIDNVMCEKIITETENIKYREFKPCIITDKRTGKTLDFAPFDILQYGDLCEKTYFSSVNELMDEFYRDRDNFERMKQKSSDLVHLLNNNIERLSKKIALLNSTLKEAMRRDEYKMYGDLLTANLYKMKQGDKNVTVQNYYDENYPEISITLNPSFSPAQNAQRYYKLYQKSKNAEIESKKQLIQANNDLEYFESTLCLVQNSTSEADLNAIREELVSLGYVKRKNQSKKQKAKINSKPHHYISSDGFDIYVGKNNTQNDMLTLRFANSGDIWFHTKNIHGSHTVIKLGIEKNVPDSTLKEAAALAAYYSKGRDSSKVPVDYTQIKNVKKPNGAKPGMVIYDNYNTIYITPTEPTLEKAE